MLCERLDSNYKNMTSLKRYLRYLPGHYGPSSGLLQSPSEPHLRKNSGEDLVFQ